MARLTQSQWRALFDEQAASGQTATAFCAERGIDNKYFSTRKKQLSAPRSESRFVAVTTKNLNPSGLQAQPGKCAGVHVFRRFCAVVGCCDKGAGLMRCFLDPPAIYLHKDAIDFRKSINGLVVFIEQEMGRSAFDPALYVFCNRARDKLKILYWDTTGFALWYKRLEKCRFKWPNQLSGPSILLSEQQLHWLLSGYDVVGHAPVIFKKCS